MANYKPIRVFNYSRRLQHMKAGSVRNMRFQGKRIKVELDKSGRSLKVLDAPKSVIDVIKNAETLKVTKGRISPVLKTTKPKRKPKPVEPPAPQPPTPTQPEPAAPEPSREEAKQPEPPPPPDPTPEPVQAVSKVPGKPKTLSEAERRKAMLVPVPDKGPIPTPFIDWANIPQHCRVSGVNYMDYPHRISPKGMLPELREMFRRSRRYQDKAPVNVQIQGLKGTGKSELIKKFAEDTGLPYWQVMGQEGIRADELLGHYVLKEGTSSWIDGVIPKAVRAGGILHIDEPNVIEPAILMRLDELMDNKRQLNMEDLNGEIIKAHPDLFLVLTMNPPTYEGVKDLPEPVKSRLTRRYIMEYPPQNIELGILKFKMKLSDKEFKTASAGADTGVFARDINDVMKVINGLRTQPDLSYTPSLRETQAFVQSLKEGDGFFKAFDTSIKNLYFGEEADRIEEALNAVRRRS